MRKPNFFVLGAPRCGTTSLAGWLAAHPQVYMSPRKEPHFFNTDHRDVLGRWPFRIVFFTPTLKLYQKQFRGATAAHKAVGEVSVWYLFSDAAIPNICEYVREPKFIVCLRSPVDMAYSLHQRMLYGLRKPALSFEDAWRLQDKQPEKKAPTRSCGEAQYFAYWKTCALGAQVERLYRRVDRERVLPLVLDDVKKDPRREYQKVLEFLGLDDDERKDFPVRNAGKELRSTLVRKAEMMAGRVRRALGISRGFGVLRHIEKRNIQTEPRPPLRPEFRRELQDYFASDVEKLGKLLNRDLSAWTRHEQG